jgi:hypothetical protein
LSYRHVRFDCVLCTEEIVSKDILVEHIIAAFA